LCTQNATKTAIPFNVKTVPQSSHHGDLGIVLTFFGWFDGAFLSMSAQKSAILANPISTIYKVGMVGLVKNTQQPK
jgi:hypothetical protein